MVYTVFTVGRTVLYCILYLLLTTREESALLPHVGIVAILHNITKDNRHFEQSTPGRSTGREIYQVSLKRTFSTSNACDVVISPSMDRTSINHGAIGSMLYIYRKYRSIGTLPRLDCSTTKRVPMPKRAFFERSRRELSFDVTVGVPILLVVELSSLESQSRGCAKTPILTVYFAYLYNASVKRKTNLWCNASFHKMNNSITRCRATVRPINKNTTWY